MWRTYIHHQSVDLLAHVGRTGTHKDPRLSQLQLDHRRLSRIASTSRNCAGRNCGHSRSTYRSPTANSIGARSPPCSAPSPTRSNSTSRRLAGAAGSASLRISISHRPVGQAVFLAVRLSRLPALPPRLYVPAPIVTCRTGTRSRPCRRLDHRAQLHLPSGVRRSRR